MPALASRLVLRRVGGDLGKPDDGLPVLPPLPLKRTLWAEVVEALRLSPQQAQIVELIIRGACDKQIALHLGLSVDTVRTYLKRISARHHVHGRVELAVKAMAAAVEIVEERRHQ